MNAIDRSTTVGWAETHVINEIIANGGEGSIRTGWHVATGNSSTKTGVYRLTPAAVAWLRGGGVMSYAERKAAGLCVRCGEPARTGKAQCADCAERTANHIAKYKAKRKARGLCVQCGKQPSRPGKVCCAACAESQAERSAEFRDKRQAAGLCPRCGKQPPRPGKAHCAGCTEYLAEHNVKHYAKLRAARKSKQ